MKNYDYIIGIDPGVTTGLAIWNVHDQCFIEVSGLIIHKALEKVKALSNIRIFVIVEDARKRKWFGNNSEAKKQGAGSVKRDCKIWEDFLKDNEIEFEMIHPLKGGTKLDSNQFKRLTHWTKQTNEHGRDAGMLVVARK